ncbi:Putative WD-repeat family protein [Giardia duodenalis]|uniref:Putative WD-repeat family protein n=1 Tax=Giardia intestinalis TaxID=5741 RepID=V6TJ78_GIAIN|nr:Putative WD-repeat family protein [Giardia intestinalis]
MVYAQLNLQTERVKCVVFHPKRPWVIFSCQNGVVELWDYVTKALIDKFRAHNSPVRCIDFHPTQPLFVTGGDDATIKLWSLSDRKLLYVFTGHTDYVRSVFFHPDIHPYILSASDDNTARIWNWQSRQRVADLVGHRDLVMCARWHPTEDLIVTASMDATVRVWDISSIRTKGATGRFQQLAMQALSLPHTIISSSVVGTGHGRGVNWVSWMPDAGNYFLSGSDDTKCKLWHLTRGSSTGLSLLGPDALLYCSSTIEKHTGNVSVVEPSARNVILTAGVDGRLCLFSLSNRAYIGSITVHDLDPTATVSSLAPSDHKMLRWWSLREHPTINMWAAGHDGGLCIFSTQLEESVGTVEGDTCYFIDSHKLISTNLKAIVADASTKPTVKVEASLIKQTARSGAFGSSVVVVEPVDIIVMGNPFPFIVSYWDGKNRFIVPYATLKDCSPSSYDPKNVIEVSSNVARLSASHVAWIQRSNEGLVLAVAFVGTGGLTIKTMHPVSSTVLSVFPGRTESEVIISSPTKLSLYTLSNLSTNQPLVLLKSLSVPQLIQHAYYSNDQQYLAVVAHEFVALINMDTFTINTSQMSHTAISRGVWGLIGRGLEESEQRTANAFIYSTYTHICYMLPFISPTASEANRLAAHTQKISRVTKPIAGILTSLNRPICIVSASGQVIVYLDRHEGLKCIEFDSRVAGLVQAVASGRADDASIMLARLQNTPLGLSLSKTLLDMNRPDLALAALPKDEIQIRDELALNLGLLDHVCHETKSQSANSYHIWLRIFAESLAQGQGLIARDALLKIARIDLLGFLLSLYNTTLSESLSKLDYSRLSTSSSIQECLNAAVLVGDKSLFHSTLLRAGLSIPAKIFGEANGIDTPVEQASAPPVSPTKTISIGKKITVPLRKGSLRNYPTTSLINTYESLMQEIASAAEHELPAEGKRYQGWGSDDDDVDCVLPAEPVKGSVQMTSGPSEPLDATQASEAAADSAIVVPSHGVNVVSKHPLLGSNSEKEEFLASNGILSEKSLSILKPHIDKLASHNKRLQEVTPMKGLSIVVPISDSLSSVDTIDTMQREFSSIMEKVDTGAFADALAPLRSLLQRALLACTFAGPNDHDDLSTLVLNSTLYILALSCELERRATEKVATPERVCELYVLFSLQNMKTNHAMLALRLAISGTKRYGAYSHCKQLAQRFIQLSQLPEARSLEVCQSYLPKAKKMAALEDEDVVQLSFSAADQDTVMLCAVSYKSIKGPHCICSACKTCACDQYLKASCPVCELGTFVKA